MQIIFKTTNLFIDNIYKITGDYERLILAFSPMKYKKNSMEPH